MAENTLLKNQNDNQNNVRYRNLSVPLLSSAVTSNEFADSASKTRKRNRCEKYLCTFNLLTILISNARVVIWTLCQLTFPLVSATTINDPVISSVNYMGYLKRELIESTVISDKASEYFDKPKTTDILLQVKGVNLDKFSNWKATQNENICEDVSNSVFKTKRAPVMSIEDHNENVLEVLLTLPAISFKQDIQWYLCIENSSTSAETGSLKSGTDWLHLGQQSKFCLPKIDTELKPHFNLNTNYRLDVYENVENAQTSSLSIENDYEINSKYTLLQFCLHVCDLLKISGPQFRNSTGICFNIQIFLSSISAGSNSPKMSIEEKEAIPKIRMRRIAENDDRQTLKTPVPVNSAQKNNSPKNRLVSSNSKYSITFSFKKNLNYILNLI